MPRERAESTLGAFGLATLRTVARSFPLVVAPARE